MRNIFDIDRFREIFETIGKNKSRSILTGFGVFWGIFMLLTLSGSGQGLSKLVADEMIGFATNSGMFAAMMTSKPYKGFKSGRQLRLTTEEMRVLKDAIPEIDVITSISSGWGEQAEYGGHSTDVIFTGVDPSYAEVMVPELKYGRFLNDVDMEQERKVCVIGDRIYKELFPEGGDPCGKFVKIGDLHFRIVGVDVATSSLNINGPAEQKLQIPFSIYQRLFNKGNEVDVICVTAKPGYSIKTILDKVKKILSERLYFSPDDPTALLEVNAENMFKIMDNLFKGINLLIWLVGFGTLLAAAIGVSNIMMVTVRERTTEIGIRRAIGATPKMILGQIMMESVILTTGAGILGIILSVGLLSLVENVVSMSSGKIIPFQVSFSFAMLSLLILTILGLLAGLAPAARAMEIKPVDAMRDE